MTTRSTRIRTNSAARREARKADTRRALLDAAASLFREQGFERFSLRQVAEATGYSATTIYLYFDDKNDLLYHVALEGFARFGEVLQAAYDEEEDPLRRLAAIGRAYVDFGLDAPVHYRLMFMQRGEFLDREPPAGHEPVIDSFAILTRTIQECLDAGRIRDGDVANYAGAIWSAVHGIVALSISTPYFDRDSARAVLKTSQRMIVEGIAT